MKNIVRIKFGSHLYGTNTPESDLDYKSVHIPDAKSIILQRVQDSVQLVAKREKSEGDKNLPGEVDDESYSLKKYLSLLAQGQTVAIDMLFAPNPEQYTSLWTHICLNKEKLLTKKSASFVGYCRTQANKYGIKGSRMAAIKEALEVLEAAAEAYGTHAKISDINHKLPIGEYSRIVEKVTTPGKTEIYFECCNRMVGFKNTIKEAYKIYSNIYMEFGKRARLAEENEGIDWKALSHAVRVGHEAYELLTTGHITFPLAYAGHILAIKKGLYKYKQVADEIEELLVMVEDASKISTLRDEPDQKFIEELVYEEYLDCILNDHFLSINSERSKG